MLAKLRGNREIRELSGQDRAHGTDHMAMAALFLLSHEVGHLLSESGISAVDDNALAATSSHRAAILRLCQQADQFNRSGFHLGGFDSGVIDPSSANRSFIEKFKAQDKFIEVTAEKFREESLADMFGADLSLRYFSRTARKDGKAADMGQYLFLENLEALATYYWYKSYFQFTDATCGGVRNSRELSLCLGLKPENSVSAADVFGKFHRNTFLRAYETFASFVSQRTSFYDIPVKDRVVATYAGDPAFEALDEKRKASAFRLMSILQRHFLLIELVDTPLKFAYTGCTLGWTREAWGGTVPLMIMQFFSYEEELERFQRKLSGK